MQARVRVSIKGLLESMLLSALALLAGCEPELVVGAWSCKPDDASAVDAMASVELPWSTSFESEFCDYQRSGGYCYGPAPAKYETVRSPVHSGRYAAAFHVLSDDSSGHQTRCVRQGELPTAAYYGAWYFVPTSARNANLWNLVHFQGGDPSGQHGLWDISLENRSDGSLAVFVFDFLHGMTRRPAKPTPIPIGAWFHLELYLRRAADATGEIALYQDGQKLLEAKNLVTDDTRWGQWYVGNLADGVTPRDSVLYVDDVTLQSSR